MYGMTFWSSKEVRMGAAIAFAGCVVTAAGQAQAAYKIGDDKSYVKVGGLLQAWGSKTEEAAPNGTSADNEFFLRRIRLMMFGQVNEHVNFFIETDNPNLGKGGNWGGSMFIQDAYVELNLHDAFQLDAGLLLVPFSHHGMQGATSLIGLDYMSSVIRYTPGSNKVWRDGGLMVRGMVADNHLEYRLGVFNGVRGNGTPVAQTVEDATGTTTASWTEATDPRNPKDVPRLAARITANVFDAEGGPGAGGMFYDGLYLKETPEGLISPKMILSFGASVDWQKDAIVSFGPAPTTLNAGERETNKSSYLALAGDAFWDLPLDSAKLMSLNGQVNVYYYDHGDRSAGTASYYDSVGASTARLHSGLGLMTELGVRYDKIMPVFQMGYFKAKDNVGEAGDYMGMFGGFNYFMYGHTTSLKARVGSEKEHGGDSVLSGQLQMQLLF
jgi:Phosphate-selective porin O and P